MHNKILYMSLTLQDWNIERETILRAMINAHAAQFPPQNRPVVKWLEKPAAEPKVPGSNPG